MHIKRLQYSIFTAALFTLCSCSQQQNPQLSEVRNAGNSAQASFLTCNTAFAGPLIADQGLPENLQLSKFIRRIHEDQRENLWFGTNGDGVIRYNGDTVVYFNPQNGFAGLAVRGIVEDKDGIIWFGTESGLSKYDPVKVGGFTNYREEDGLINNDIWSLYLDDKGTIWIGTLEGVSRFDGKEFSTFELPETEPDYSRGVTSSRIVHSIMQDSKGKMWFGTNGGAFVFDGQIITNISTKNGLCHDVVNDILEDRQGNFWFATHHRGVCRWDGETFTQFDSTDGVGGTEIWSLFEDSQGNIWFPSEGYGVYSFYGEGFARFHYQEGMTSNAIQCIFEDSKGIIWCGGYQGLFRLNQFKFIPVGKNGPWDDDC